MDLFSFALKDFDVEALADLVMVEYRTHREPNLIAQRPLGTPDTGLDLDQVLLGGIEQHGTRLGQAVNRGRAQS